MFQLYADNERLAEQQILQIVESMGQDDASDDERADRQKHGFVCCSPLRWAVAVIRPFLQSL